MVIIFTQFMLAHWLNLHGVMGKASGSSCCRLNLITGRWAKAPKIVWILHFLSCSVKQMSSTIFISLSCSHRYEPWSNDSISAHRFPPTESEQRIKPFTCCLTSPHFPSGFQYFYKSDPRLWVWHRHWKRVWWRNNPLYLNVCPLLSRSFRK